ncbi:enolase C-terminal domain-like protein [Xenorhabdus anantnagensis]|uniref:Enolase C-terminal domain-like protein n=1 Tax=Xenorhabdus anantnagensis TaxID=3025875 RepID=A0ABT5LY81_9GAMM|nr:enolase C-terminal domain-like protein [Xenorhabdus anantnagensis]MDC9598793.1 enolase C-terminal domain-like protein [Xenorhabdus anantnagensis]
MTIANAFVHNVQEKMAVPFKHSSFARWSSESIVLELNVDGVIGYGECAPRQYVTGESIDVVHQMLTFWIKERLMSVAHSLVSGVPFDEVLADEFSFIKDAAPNACCAIELAIMDWLEKSTRTPLGPKAVVDSAPFVPVLDSYGRWNASDSVIAKAPLVKLKLADTLEETCKRISVVRKQTSATVLIDANNAWSKKEIPVVVPYCMDAGAEWFEEPCKIRDYQTLREIRTYGAKVLLDESVQNENDIIVALDAEAVDGINIRIAKCGGLSCAGRIANLAKTKGLARYYGVQVAEVGTLITAGRILALSDSQPLGVEAGQSDLFFNSDTLWVTNPALSRDRGIITRTHNDQLNGRNPKS